MALKKEKKKIGIVTFFYGKNYGGVLQTYALQRFLIDNKIETEIVNYEPDTKKNYVQTVKNFIRKLIRKKSKVDIFSEVFLKFMKKYFILSRKYNSYNVLSKSKYDILISGSDQIWNSKLNKDTMPYFLLDFGACEKISYASCIGQPSQLKDYEKYLSSELSNFSHISVRNNFSKDYVKNFCVTKSVNVSCDPTLLINFDSLLEPYRLPFDNYILVYTLNVSLEGLINTTVSRLKEIYNFPIVVLNSKYFIEIKNNDLSIYDATPFQWISLVKNASYVVTDSFHGVVFSLKYKRKFIVLHGNDWRSHRLLDAAHRYRFEEKCVYDIPAHEVLRKDIDYSITEKEIIQHVVDSKKYLLCALNLDNNDDQDCK